MREPTEEQFLEDVSTHEMTVKTDKGIYRHLHFQAKDRGWNMWFDLVTWPGVLTIHGDMGTWTFSRVDDMFTFFRDSQKLRINPSYWAEKLQHGNFSGREGGKVWDEDDFKKRVLALLSEHHGFEGDELTEVTEAVKLEFSRHEGDGPHVMRSAIYEFAHRFSSDGRRFQFDGMDLPDGMVYSYYFIWCLYAIVWGIRQWDKRSVAVEVV